MSTSEQANAKGSGSKRQWTRSSVVCTSCRQAKARCDYQERFPNPCTKCAGNPNKKSSCHVDLGYKRVSKRKTRNTSNGNAEPKNGRDIITLASDTSPGPSTSNDPHFNGEEFEESIFTQGHSDIEAPIFFQVGPDRAVGDVHLSGAEISLCFTEFFTFYHPFIRLLPYPMLPEETFTNSPLLFWSIIAVSTAPHPEHRVLPCRTPELHLAAYKHAQTLAGEILVQPPRTHVSILGLLLLAEYPMAILRDRYGHRSLYTILAVNMGHILGLHRPQHGAEFIVPTSSPDETGHSPMSVESLRQRTLTWLQTFIIHQCVSAQKGLPSTLYDDYVLTEASWPVKTQHAWLSGLDSDVFKLVRIHRLTLRISSALHTNTSSPTGTHDVLVGHALISLFDRDFTSLEQALAPMSNRVAVYFFQAKMQLHMFSFQCCSGEDSDSEQGPAPESVLACYASAIRLIRTTAQMQQIVSTRSHYWPRSLWVALLAAIICLIKLESLMPSYPQMASLLNRDVISREVATGYSLIYPGGISGSWFERQRQIIGFLSREMAHRHQTRSSSTEAGDGAVNADIDTDARRFKHKARSSLGNLLHDAICGARERLGYYMPTDEELEKGKAGVTGDTSLSHDTQRLTAAGYAGPVTGPHIPDATGALTGDFGNDAEADFGRWLASLSAEECQTMMDEMGMYQPMITDDILQPTNFMPST